MSRIPKIHFVLLSHLHGDHFDRSVIAKFTKNVPILAPQRCCEVLAEKHGFWKCIPLDRWETVKITTDNSEMICTISAVPARHGPILVNLALPQVNGWVIEVGTEEPATLSSATSTDGKSQRLLGHQRTDSADQLPMRMVDPLRIYISGDTLLIDQISEICERFPHIDVALIHLGGARAFGVTLSLNATNGVKLMNRIQADVTIPIHTDSYDAFKSGAEQFGSEILKAGLQDAVCILRQGEVYRFPRTKSWM